MFRGAGDAGRGGGLFDGDVAVGGLFDVEGDGGGADGFGGEGGDALEGEDLGVVGGEGFVLGEKEVSLCVGNREEAGNVRASRFRRDRSGT